MNGTETGEETLPQQPPLAATIPDQLTAVPAPDTKAEIWRLILQIGSANRIVSVELADQMLIGRSDPAQGYYADLDLTPFGGRGAGVSRRHATVYLAHDALYIRDLDSANGTLVNGIRLEAQRLYHLNEKDKISLGKLDFSVVSAQPLVR